MSKLLLGVDGGGTKTTVLAATLDGRVVGRGVSGPSNFYAVGEEAARTALDKAIEEALRAAGAATRDVGALSLGLAGVDRPEERAVVQRWIDARFPGVPAMIVNDARLVLAAGTPDGWGVAVVAGTGSHIYGRDPAGNTARAGGWGYILGDEGSGYAMGLMGLRAVARAADGRGPQTALTQAILSYWGLDSPWGLVHYVYRPSVGRVEISRLGKVVQECAAEGDAVALEIVQEAGRELVIAVRAVIRQLGLPSPVPCGLAGGVIVKGRMVREAFEAEARAAQLRLEPITPVLEPAQGAVRLAQSLVEGMD